MARVTVEDCVEQVPNRFDLVMMAGQRARTISAGAPLTLDRDNDKNPVVALREIADSNLNLGELEEMLVRGHQRLLTEEEEETVSVSEEVSESIKEEGDWASHGVGAGSDFGAPPEAAGLYGGMDVVDD